MAEILFQRDEFWQVLYSVLALQKIIKEGLPGHNAYILPRQIIQSLHASNGGFIPIGK